MRRMKLLRKILLPGLLVTAFAAAWPQEASQSHSETAAASASESLQGLQQQIAELKSIILEMRGEVVSNRKALADLQEQLRETRASLAGSNEVASRANESALVAAPTTPAELQQQPAAAESEELSLLKAKIDEQYQTKVESASKYRVRLSGIVLFNMFSNSGSVDNLDFPHLVRPSGIFRSTGNFGGSLRQSQLGFELFGPTIGGAKTSANVELDFAGGFSNTLNGVSSGIVRLRTGTMRFDWDRTSVIAGQDGLFFSPLSPTSLASLALPAFAYTGNLWSWIPQVRVEHKMDVGSHKLLLQGGLLDGFDGEPPYAPFYRTRQAGENSHQPAYALRAAWSQGASDEAATLGIGGYYSRQNWNFGRTVDGWAGMADWSIPLGELFKLSGEFYGGRAAGGLGAGIGRSVLANGPLGAPTSSIVGADMLGGWAQLKFKPTAKLEFNAAFGQDDLRAAQVRAFLGAQNMLDPQFDYALTRNRSGLVNLIYRLRSNVLLSLENRQLQTSRVDDTSATANHTSMSIGVLF